MSYTNYTDDLKEKVVKNIYQQSTILIILKYSYEVKSGKIKDLSKISEGKEDDELMKPIFSMKINAYYYAL